MNEPIRLLHLEDRDDDAVLVRLALLEADLPCEVYLAKDGPEFRAAVERGNFDAVLSDSSVPGFDGLAALQLTREKRAEVPFIFVCGDRPAGHVASLKQAGATDFVPKERLPNLAPAILRALEERQQAKAAAAAAEGAVSHPMERLIGVIQQLSLARDLATIMEIVRHAARDLTGADGATFVLRDNGQCYYAEEDAISPLWKGCRFPMSACISGWAMLNRQAAIIPDIYVDPRIPVDAYRPTFVKSLVMVPIRTSEPIGAIGNYWATPHAATPQEVQLLQALADSTSIAMENVAVYQNLENTVAERTQELEAANRDLESFSYSVSHDLRAPLRSMGGFSRLVLQKYAHQLDENGAGYLQRIVNSAEHMGNLIEDLLRLAGIGRTPLRRQSVDLVAMARDIVTELRGMTPDRKVDIRLPQEATVQGDPGLLRVVMENLLSNAWKYSSKRAESVIEFSSAEGENGERIFKVSDNGAGFDPKYASRLFGVFQRLHAESEFPGTGVGLATVQRIIQKHHGRVWAESAVDQGARFFFTLG